MYLIFLRLRVHAIYLHILLERKCVQEDASGGGNIKKSMSHKFYNVTAYACVLSDTFSLQEDIKRLISALYWVLLRINEERKLT